jgi:adenylate cyclase
MTDTPKSDIETAEALSQKALAASPRSGAAHFAKGDVLRAERRYQDAIPEFETVLAINHNSAPALHALADCKFWTGSIDEVIPLEEQGIRLSPHEPQIAIRYAQIGRVYLLRSHTNEAIAWLEKARGANSETPYIFAWLASAYVLTARRIALPPN